MDLVSELLAQYGLDLSSQQAEFNTLSPEQARQLLEALIQLLQYWYQQQGIPEGIIRGLRRRIEFAVNAARQAGTS